MANEKTPNETKEQKKKNNLFRQGLQQINSMIGKASLSLYGTDRTSDVDKLNDSFQNILQNELDSITKKDSNDVTSFLSKVYSQDKKTAAVENLLDNQFMSISGDEYSTMQSFIYEAYRNKLLEQSDLHEVASQLIELSEAILITRDSIVSADVVEGRMSRTVSFGNIDDKDAADNAIPTVEHIEKRFKLQEKIKNFIIPKTLEYGEYYVYIIPYSKIFNDFVRQRDKNLRGKRIYRESTLLESVELEEKKNKVAGKKGTSQFINDLYMEYVENSERENNNRFVKKEKPNKEEFTKDIKNMLGNITICNESVPIPVLEEGFNSIEHYMTEYVNESGDTYIEKDSLADSVQKDNSSFFDKVINRTTKSQDSKEGIFYQKDSKKKNDFDDIKDCYIQLIEPTRMLPLKIMNQVIGYYYVVAEDITPLSGMVSSTLYYSKFDEERKEQNIIDSIAERIVQSFDKDFLKDNLKFKKTIVDAINHYNLNVNKLKFQFIPVEYVQSFKIDEDENGDGTSMIKKSLFYAKLYLMLLLFKIMSIILYSNDQKVNYIKTSGIDKNVANKVQEIARIKQSRQINMIDLFNYTTLINKVGNGTEMYVPTGRTNERPIETEILSGQDVQLNSDLLEMLKNAYILGTGVPAAIVNYLNEADFAKVIEQNNTKFNGRVVNYQLDFNSSITEMYKKIMRWSTDLPENIIDNFQFTLQAPKTTATSAKSDAINNFTSLSDFVVSIAYDDPNETTNPDLKDEIRNFKLLFAEEQLPMLNMDSIKELMSKAKIKTKEEKLAPNPVNGDSNDDGFDGNLTGF